MSHYRKQYPSLSERQHRGSSRWISRVGLVFVAAIFATTSASAQQIYTAFTIGAKPGDAYPQACVDATHLIGPVVSKYPHPTQHRWIIACNDYSWNALLVHLGWDASGKYTMALTDQRAGITYVRAEAIVHPTHGEASAPEHIIAHELAHIFLRSSDEDKVDAQAQTWMKQAKLVAVNVEGGR